jgi:hypothetical protein
MKRSLAEQNALSSSVWLAASPPASCREYPDSHHHHKLSKSKTSTQSSSYIPSFVADPSFQHGRFPSLLYLSCEA